MAPVFSRPFDVILQEASSLPPASQLSTGLLRILRRALNASRKSLPKKTSSDGTIIRGFRQQATTGKLSFADGAWLDVFLVSRGTWMDHGLLSGKAKRQLIDLVGWWPCSFDSSCPSSAFAASDEKEVYARVLRQHTGKISRRALCSEPSCSPVQGSHMKHAGVDANCRRGGGRPERN